MELLVIVNSIQPFRSCLKGFNIIWIYDVSSVVLGFGTSFRCAALLVLQENNKIYDLRSFLP